MVFLFPGVVWFLRLKIFVASVADIVYFFYYCYLYFKIFIVKAVFIFKAVIVFLFIFSFIYCLVGAFHIPIVIFSYFCDLFLVLPLLS